MTARVLIVDDIVANVKLLEARLTAEYFEVLTAGNGPEALEICRHEEVDVVLLDVMMPGMDGFEVCRRLKAQPKTQGLPVIMVTALDQTSDKIQGLEVGADDFLTKPVDEIALITRVRNLARLKTLNDEMLMRAATGAQLGLAGDPPELCPSANHAGRVLLVDDHPRTARRVLESLAQQHNVSVENDVRRALASLAGGTFDLLMVSLDLERADGLRLCSQVRSLEQTRHLPIIIMIDAGEQARLLRALDMGVNDYLTHPIDRHEMAARVGTQIKRKRYSDFLRARLEERVEQAMTDPLTGLHNRRYMESHIRSKLEEALARGQPFSVLIADIDYFKSVNDTFGHDIGDTVLQEFAVRLKRYTRSIDLAARLGGEEFVIAMPDTNMERAYQVAERLRARIEAEPFRISHAGEAIRVTASIGLACLEHADETVATLLKRADRALYQAKNSGRNRVTADAAPLQLVGCS